MREQHAQQPPVQRRASTEAATPMPPRRSGTGAAPASPHRVGHAAGLHPEDAPFPSSHLRREAVPAAVEEEEREQEDE